MTMTNKMTLLGSAAAMGIRPTASERLQGRIMRAPEGHQDGGAGAGGDTNGGNQGGSGNNGGGNSGGSGQSEGNQNNGGQGFDLNAFWNGAAEDGTGTPSGESDGTGKPPVASPKPDAGTQQPNIAEQIAATNFGDLLTPDMLEKFGEGDVKGFNEGLNGFGQAVMRQTLVQSVGIMRQLREQIFAEVEAKIDGRVTGDRQHDALIKAIPSAGKPEMGPTIKNIYSRALTNSKGNVEKAIEQTKQVLQLQAEAFGGDLGLNVAPKGPADQYAPPKTTDWLESLAGN